jgi:hypothetical protein
MMFVPVNRGTPVALQFVVPLATPLPPRSFAQVTRETATLSAAVPPNDIVEYVVAYVAPVVGVLMANVGRVVSPPVVVLLMTQVNVCEAVSTPSNARTVTLYVPAVVPAPEM